MKRLHDLGQFKMRKGAFSFIPKNARVQEHILVTTISE